MSAGDSHLLAASRVSAVGYGRDCFTRAVSIIPAFRVRVTAGAGGDRRPVGGNPLADGPGARLEASHRAACLGISGGDDTGVYSAFVSTFAGTGIPRYRVATNLVMLGCCVLGIVLLSQATAAPPRWSDGGKEDTAR